MHFSTSARSLALLFLSSALTISARDVPQNVREFYNKVKGNRQCSNPLASGFWSTDWGTNSKPSSALLPLPPVTFTLDLYPPPPTPP